MDNRHRTVDDRDLYSGLIRLHILHQAVEGRIFGLAMTEELRRHGYRISPGTLYPLLHGLEKKGYLRSVDERNGKSRRKLYWVIGMILFIVDMGRILLTQEFITERAGTTLRQAVVNNWSATQIQNVLCYNSTDGGAGTGYMGLTPANVSSQFLGSSTTPDYRLQVKVSGLPISTWIPFIAGKYTLPSVVLSMPAESLGATN